MGQKESKLESIQQKVLESGSTTVIFLNSELQTQLIDNGYLIIVQHTILGKCYKILKDNVKVTRGELKRILSRAFPNVIWDWDDYVNNEYFKTKNNLSKAELEFIESQAHVTNLEKLTENITKWEYANNTLSTTAVSILLKIKMFHRLCRRN